MITELPSSPEGFANATWDDLRPHYEELLAASLDGAEALPWLERWNRLEELLGEAATLANLAYSADTADPVAEAANLRFSSEIGPLADEQRVQLSGRLLDSGFQRQDLDSVLNRFRNQREIFREANVPIQAKLQRLQAAYQKITGSLVADWRGEEKTLPELTALQEVPDRSVREAAFRLLYGTVMGKREELAGLFTEMYGLRQKSAHNAGFDNYRDYMHRAKNRFDYTPADCERWHAGIEEVFAPLAARLAERRRQRMGLDRLRPWDLAADPDALPPLKPYAGQADLLDRSEAVFGKVDPVFGERFRTMRAEKLLDLPNRKGKRAGAFCTGLSWRRRPFVFGNCVGTADDVRTLLHEMGHAFHAFETMEHLQFVFQRHPGSEMAEVASMSMELLAAPYLTRAQGGFYTDEEFARERFRHLESIVSLLGHIASVDAFQHWIYTDAAGADPDARDAKWLEIRERFDSGGIDWTGLQRERIGRWYRQIHFFAYPFYYIEYGIAQLASLQVWRNSLRDQGETIAAYRGALALGGTRPLPDLYAAAGARLVFDAEGMRELAHLIEQHLD